MKTPRIDIDTAVIGGCFDVECAPWSNGLMHDFHRGLFHPVLSEVVAVAIHPAPEPVRVQYAELLNLGAAFFAVSDEALDLAAVYEARGILTPRFRNDLLQMALATVADVDIVVSWNFRHVVWCEKLRLFNAVTLEFGDKPIQIYSPREVPAYDTDADQSS